MSNGRGQGRGTNATSPKGLVERRVGQSPRSGMASDAWEGQQAAAPAHTWSNISVMKLAVLFLERLTIAAALRSARTSAMRSAALRTIA